MEIRTLKIGNMCCGRCILVVTQLLNQLDIKYTEVDLGYAIITDKQNISDGELELNFKKVGFEIIKSKEEDISEKIKIAIHKLFLNIEIINFSKLIVREYLETQLQLPYKTLSEIFSKKNKKTIENYFISRKIEKVKAMINDSNYSFSQIAFKLGYNSHSYLSKQFKISEGVTMREYKNNNMRV